MDEGYAYAGGELDLFAAALNWKRHWTRQVAPHVGGRVLEVGAGLGANVPWLYRDGVSWTCLEPDPGLAGRLRARRAAGEIPAACEVACGDLSTLPAGPRWDTILYADVLEHIADDRGEVERAAARLAPGGHLVVLAPAHGWLYTPFDAAIGHHRRYTRRTLAALTAPGLDLVAARYLDAAGMLASLMNRVLLRSAHPTAGQIALWDRVLVPVSMVLDQALGYRLGKSVLAVWRRQ